MGKAGIPTIIDGDGHVIEFDHEIIPYLTDKYPEDGLRGYYLFPTLDGWRRGTTNRPPGSTPRGALLWMEVRGHESAKSDTLPTTGEQRGEHCGQMACGTVTAAGSRGTGLHRRSAESAVGTVTLDAAL